MAQHLVVSCFIMRMPESAISKLVRGVGEKWEDTHDRLMVKVLGHAAVGLEPQWTNDSKSVNKVENKACSGRVCKCARLGRPTCGTRTSDGHSCLFTWSQDSFVVRLQRGQDRVPAARGESGACRHVPRQAGRCVGWCCSPTGEPRLSAVEA